jgi:hypothetical protein
MNDIRARVLAKSFTEAQLMETILEVRIIIVYKEEPLTTRAVRRPERLDSCGEQHQAALRINPSLHTTHPDVIDSRRSRFPSVAHVYLPCLDVLVNTSSEYASIQCSLVPPP